MVICGGEVVGGGNGESGGAVWRREIGGGRASGMGRLARLSLQKKYTPVMIRVCHNRSRFLSCMYIHDKFMTESR